MGALAALACGGSQTPAPEPPDVASDEPVPETITDADVDAVTPDGHVTIGKIDLARDGEVAVTLHEDGRVEHVASGKVLGTMHADGSFKNPDGKVIARLTEEGEYLLASGKRMPVKLIGDDTIDIEAQQRQVKMTDDGKFPDLAPGGPQVHLRGVSAETRRAAIYLLLIVAFPTHAAPSAAPPTSEASATPEASETPAAK